MLPLSERSSIGEMFFNFEKPNRPIPWGEVLGVLQSLKEGDDPEVSLSIKFRSLQKRRHAGHYGAIVPLHDFRPAGYKKFIKANGKASEVHRQCILCAGGEKHDAHIRNGEVVQAVRIRFRDPLGVYVEALIHPPREG